MGDEYGQGAGQVPPAGAGGLAEGEDVGKAPGAPAPEGDVRPVEEGAEFGDLREEDVTRADGLDDREA